MCRAPGTWPFANSARERTSRIAGAAPDSMRARSASALIRSAAMSVKDAHGLANEGGVVELSHQEVRDVGARHHRQRRLGSDVFADPIRRRQTSVGQLRRTNDRPVNEAFGDNRLFD